MEKNSRDTECNCYSKCPIASLCIPLGRDEILANLDRCPACHSLYLHVDTNGRSCWPRVKPACVSDEWMPDRSTNFFCAVCHKLPIEELTEKWNAYLEAREK